MFSLNSNKLFGTTIFLFLFLVIYPLVDTYISGTDIYSIVFLLIFRLALFFFAFHMLGYWLYRNEGVRFLERKRKNVGQVYSLPAVAILIPVKDEPDHLLKRMFKHLRAVSYPNKTIFVIDNSTDNKTSEFRQFALNAGLVINVLRKSDCKGYKAGALNFALSTLGNDYKYILVLDIDHAPCPEIIDCLVQHIEANPKLAFVQAPQSYDEGFFNIFSDAYLYKQRIFYDHVCPGLSANGSLFMLGTNVLIRKQILDEIRGFDSTSLTEDLRTSLILHQNGYRGAYIKDKLTYGYPPLDLRSYHGQQRRWAIGTFQNYFFAINIFWKSPSSLTLEQWMLYLGWNGTFYFYGVIGFILLLSSMVHLLLGNYRPYLAPDMLILALFLTTITATMNYERKITSASWRKIFLYKMIFFGDFLITAQAFMDFLRNKNLVFEVTAKASATNSPQINTFTWFHVFLAVSLGVVISWVLCEYTINSLPFLPLVWLTVFLLQSAMVAAISVWHSQFFVKNRAIGSRG